MNYYEFVTRKNYLSFNEAIKVLLPIYVNAHNWNVDETIGMVYDRKNKYILNSILLGGINNKRLTGSIIYSEVYDSGGFPVIDPVYGDILEELNYVQSKVDLKSLLEFIVDDLKGVSNVPADLLLAAGVHNSLPSCQPKVDNSIAAELGTLRNEKQKWHDSIRAAVRTGMLFFEGKLPIPATKEDFMSEFKEQLGEGLPDATIEIIYKALPGKYRNRGGRPKKTTIDVENIIRAAAYAGTLHEAPEHLTILNLKRDLKKAGITPPDDATLKIIIEAVKALDI